MGKSMNKIQPQHFDAGVFGQPCTANAASSVLFFVAFSSDSRLDGLYAKTLELACQ